jgi:hypothetical protein
MKKIIFFIVVFIMTTKVGFAQTETDASKYFEGGHEFASFQKAMQTYGANDIGAKLIGYEDTEKEVKLAISHMKTEDGLALAVLLIKAPSLMNLTKERRPNAIITDHGIIVIAWTNNEWELMFIKTPIIAHNGARVFHLYNK